MNPIVSVIMSAYNSSEFISDAIESILSQSYSNFEFIIINDGSTDATDSIIKSYNDPRIIYHSNEYNIGLVKSLNYGISISRGVYIARMDSDDVAFSNRLKLQVEFLEKNKQYGLVGSNALYFDSKRRYKVPENNEEIIAYMLINSPIIHPSIMIRSNLLKDNLYDSFYKRIEDYELWVRLSKCTKFYNLQEPLLRYRVLKNSESRLLNNDLKEKLKLHSIILNELLEGHSLASKEIFLHLYVLYKLDGINRNIYPVDIYDLYVKLVGINFRYKKLLIIRWLLFTLNQKRIVYVLTNFIYLIKFILRFK